MQQTLVYVNEWRKHQTQPSFTLLVTGISTYLSVSLKKFMASNDAVMIGMPLSFGIFSGMREFINIVLLYGVILTENKQVSNGETIHVGYTIHFILFLFG